MSPGIVDWHLRHAGYDLANGPSAVDIVIALRDRVHTLAEMAERARVWFEPLRDYDEAAVARHLTDAAVAPLASVRERLADAPNWTPEAVHAALVHTAEALRGWAWARSRNRCGWRSPAPRCRRPIEHTVYLAGRDAALERIDAALVLIAKRTGSAGTGP